MEGGSRDDAGARLDGLARAVVARGMGVPAVLFLEGARPLRLAGAQVLAAFAPLLGAVLGEADARALREALERPGGLEELLASLEAAEAGRRGR